MEEGKHYFSCVYWRVNKYEDQDWYSLISIRLSNTIIVIYASRSKYFIRHKDKGFASRFIQLFMQQRHLKFAVFEHYDVELHITLKMLAVCGIMNWDLVKFWRTLERLVLPNILLIFVSNYESKLRNARLGKEYISLLR